MKCPKCMAANNYYYKYCHNCGEKLPAYVSDPSEQKTAENRDASIILLVNNNYSQKKARKRSRKLRLVLLLMAALILISAALLYYFGFFNSIGVFGY